MRPEKKYIAEELKERYANNSLMIVTSYHGLTSENMNDLRTSVFNNNGRIDVVKNRLLKRILPDDIEKNPLDELLKGPSAIAATDSDIVALAKIISEFAKETKTLKIRGGILELSKVLNAEDITALASLPSKEILLARLLAAIKGPVTNITCLLNTMVTNMVRVLDQVAKAKAEAGEGVAAAAPAEEAPAEEAPAEEKAEAPAEEAPAEEKAEEAPAEEKAEEDAKE